MLYRAADIFFFVFHIALILFNLFGWLFKRTRRLNLITLGATAFSWLVLGIFYGFGYCFLTDWHWAVREHLGHENPHDSYIQFLITEFSGAAMPDSLVDAVTAGAFVIAIVASAISNWRDWKRNREPVR